MLNQEQRSRLLRIARESIEKVLDGSRLELDLATLDEDLKRPSGAFVSLHDDDGDLRGCIGSIQAVAPLAHAVSSSAVNAAFRDPRFPPVTQDELAGLHIEISVMSPIERVTSIEEIEVGRDGLIISRGTRAGLLLPQVATDYAWDRETFLSQTCIKAGLSAESWRSADCRIERFSAEVFGE
ncbi:MAG TPA: AmmeMemoRadiSam system protein A [Thermoanaerobaculia bacterium]|jgi:AmmeMemoRadiSam system protein A|nr:AmmeMemoRadiSam system protein A [Thermoanaerobaculia bacterium]